MNAVAFLWQLLADYGWLWTVALITAAGVTPFLAVAFGRWV